MHLAAELVPHAWLRVAVLAYAAIVAGAALRAPWRQLARPRRQHLLLGCAVAVLLLWTLNASLGNGVHYHFLGATLATLMLGWPLAVVSLSLALVGTAYFGESQWAALGINGLVAVGLPVLAAETLRRTLDRWLPHHFFIYVYGNGFFGAGLIIGVAGATTAALLAAIGGDAAPLAQRCLLSLPFLMFGEAFLSGMMTTVLVVYRPEWMTTFDDRLYLFNK